MLLTILGAAFVMVGLFVLALVLVMPSKLDTNRELWQREWHREV